MQSRDLGELAVRAKEFGEKLAVLKAAIAPGPVTWYPYESLSALAALDQTISGDSRFLLKLAGGDPILDVGCADGDLAFFLESLGCRVEAIDNPITNFNAMCGVRELNKTLHSAVEIHAIDLDSAFVLPLSEYGLVLMLGVLYHLKRPLPCLGDLPKRRHSGLITT